MNTANFLSIPSMMFPDQEILVFEGTRLTYGQELERVRRLASMLRDLGIKPGDRVAMLQTNSHQFIEAYYATATLGATFVPLNYRAKQEELQYMLSASETSVLFIGDRYIDLHIDSHAHTDRDARCFCVALGCANVRRPVREPGGCPDPAAGRHQPGPRRQSMGGGLRARPGAEVLGGWPVAAGRGRSRQWPR